MEENTEQRIDLTLFSEKIQGLKERIASVIVGQEQTVDLVLTAILANGHVLIEGVPGVAKTLLARLTARLIDADFSRIQFTPDLMPSDVLGMTVDVYKRRRIDRMIIFGQIVKFIKADVYLTIVFFLNHHCSGSKIPHSLTVFCQQEHKNA